MKKTALAALMLFLSTEAYCLPDSIIHRTYYAEHNKKTVVGVIYMGCYIGNSFFKGESSPYVEFDPLNGLDCTQLGEFGFERKIKSCFQSSTYVNRDEDNDGHVDGYKKLSACVNNQNSPFD